jgi:hypothetical protein
MNGPNYLRTRTISVTTMSPKRIQLQRVKDWRKPDGAVVVSRPTRWGNPFTVAGALESGFATDTDQARKLCVEAFRSCLVHGPDSQWWSVSQKDHFAWILNNIHVLHGKDLACWCPEDASCHGSVLIELSNA